jgi:hypothetical protein
MPPTPGKPFIPPTPEEGGKSGGSSSGDDTNYWWIIVTVFVVCLVIIGLIFIVYRVWMKRDLEQNMKGQINMAVS